MQTAHIYYLDIENNPDLFARMTLQEYVPTFEEFQEHWERVGADEVPDETTELALAKAFEKWQAGPAASEAFQNAEVREMSVGDVIMLDDAAHIVKPVGFEEVPF